MYFDKKIIDTSVFLNSLLEESSHNFTKEFKLIAKLKIDQVVQLGTFLHDERATGVAFLVKFLSSLNNIEYTDVVCHSQNIIYLKNIIINAYIYNNYEKPDDIIWVREKSIEFCNKILKCNL